MFKLFKNTYKENGVCLYKDENGNNIYMRRTEEGFTSKLRFMDVRIKAEPLYIKIPNSNDGETLRLTFSNEVSPEDYEDITNDYGKIVDHWAEMCLDLEIMDKKKQSGINIHEDIVKLREYEELKPVIDFLL